MNRSWRARGVHRAAILVLIGAAAGCASIGSMMPASGAAPNAGPTPMPMVQNCAVVNIGSPSKFACNGKVYTTFELAKIREQAAKKAAGGN